MRKLAISLVVLVSALVLAVVLTVLWYFFGYSYVVVPEAGASVNALSNASKLL